MFQSRILYQNRCAILDNILRGKFGVACWVNHDEGHIGSIYIQAIKDLIAQSIKMNFVKQNDVCIMFSVWLHGCHKRWYSSILFVSYVTVCLILIGSVDPWQIVEENKEYNLIHDQSKHEKLSRGEKTTKKSIISMIDTTLFDSQIEYRHFFIENKHNCYFLWFRIKIEGWSVDCFKIFIKTVVEAIWKQLKCIIVPLLAQFFQ